MATKVGDSNGDAKFSPHSLISLSCCRTPLICVRAFEGSVGSCHFGGFFLKLYISAFS